MARDLKGKFEEEMLECLVCKKLASPTAVLPPQQNHPGPGDSSYSFTCSNCSEDGKPAFRHTNKTWTEATVSALHNLERINKKRFFSQSEICAFIDANWDQFCIGKTKSSWVGAIQKQLTMRTSFFEPSADETTFALVRNSSHDDHVPPVKSKRTKYGNEVIKKTKKQENLIEVSPEKQSVDRSGFMWCHQCKQKHGQVIYCSRTCSKKYCTRCVKRHYREKVEDIDQSQWVCYYCQGVCSCAFCRRRRAKETNTKFESHRGKKRRIVADVTLDDPSIKKRKLKSSGSSTLADDLSPFEEKSTKNKHDDWIVEDEEDDQSVRSRTEPKKQPRKRSNVPSSSATTTTATSTPKTRRRRRVTLKDLIESNILSVGDELSFRNADTTATLLHDGHIQWSGITFGSLSTFAKKVANSLGIGTNGTLYNGWRVVSCKGKIMDQYRKEYLNFSDNFRDEEEFCEDNNLEENEEDDEDVGEEEDDEIDDSCNNLSPSMGDCFDEGTGSEGGGSGAHEKEERDDSTGDYAGDSTAESSGGESVRESYSDSANDSGMDCVGYENGDMLGDENVQHGKIGRAETKREIVKQEKYDPMWEQQQQLFSVIPNEELDDTDTPVHHLDDIYFNASIFLSSEAEEQDILIIGNRTQHQTFLDIRDKDFFNITSGDDPSINLHHSRTVMSHLEDSIHHPPLSETVEEFYSGGIDTDYF